MCGLAIVFKYIAGKSINRKPTNANGFNHMVNGYDNSSEGQEEVTDAE
jgi:hypothetical protein